MANINIETSANTNLNQRAPARSLVWISSSIGYIFFINSASDLICRKTTDSGATWTTTITIKTGTVLKFGIWYDKWINGDVGDVIHIVYGDSVDLIIYYDSFSTTDDTLDGAVTIYTGTIMDTSLGNHNYSITKSRGGKIYIASGFRFNELTSSFVVGNASPATSFTDLNNPYEGLTVGSLLLDPGNEDDNDDIWCIFWRSNNLTLKVYDASANSWSETSIATDMSINTSFMNLDVCHRHSDNHTIVVSWTGSGTAGNQVDLRCFDVGSVSDISQKTNIITNTAEYGCCGIMINQQTNDLYVGYLGGTDLSSLVNPFYKLSSDGGNTWGTQIALSENSEDDMRQIFCGTMTGFAGGRWMPAWFNDDLDDIITNSVNSISISSGTAASSEKQININDVWREINAMKINIGDAWKDVSSAKINIGDAWKTIF